MSGAVSYAAAVSTPNGTLRQPQIQARACSLDGHRSSLEDVNKTSKTPTKPQRPGAGVRSRTSFRGWASKKKNEGERGVVQQVDERTQGHQWTAKDEHRPNTGADEDLVYVLTLKITDALAAPMNAMRERYFPKRLNRIPAHLTLFHALPHSHIEALESGLNALAAEMQPFSVTTGGPFRMRKGMGVNVDEGYQKMKIVHGQLQDKWMDFLSEQDAGGFRPHWTVMNKVDEEEKVDEALKAVRKELSQHAKEGEALGLVLWRYDRGNWVYASEYTFGDTGAPLSKTQSSRSQRSARVQFSAQEGTSVEQKAEDGPKKRPGMGKRQSSMADAWRSLSFRRKS